MIVYIKTQNGGIYASPVFAEFGKDWKIKSVVLDEAQKNLMLLSMVAKNDKFNYFYIDESSDEGWVKQKKDVCGFSEIIENQKMVKNLLNNKKISIDGLECVKKYKLPLEAKTKFDIENEKDFETFNALCWGLHDADIYRLTRDEKDLVIDFDTHWQKHIIMTFHDVIEEKNLDKFMFLYGSEFKFVDGGIKWFSDEFQDLDEDIVDEVFVVSKKISYELVVDDDESPSWLVGRD